MLSHARLEMGLNVLRRWSGSDIPAGLLEYCIYVLRNRYSNAPLTPDPSATKAHGQGTH